jgi:hypothetical protein
MGKRKFHFWKEKIKFFCLDFEDLIKVLRGIMWRSMLESILMDFMLQGA